MKPTKAVSVSRNAGNVKFRLKVRKLGHKGIIQNLVDAILHGTPLIAPGEEGIKGLMISNAMLLSTWTDNWVDLPIDEEFFEQHLQEKIKNSKANKEAGYSLKHLMSKDMGEFEMQKNDGMNYAPKGKPNLVVQKGEFNFAAIALDHGHIYGMCNGLNRSRRRAEMGL